jgi:NAD(P)H-hydrate epimerase
LIWTLLPHVVPEAPPGTTSNQALAGLTASMLERLDAVLVGPGLGPEEAMGERMDTRAGWQALQEFRGLLVLDADGLNQLARTGEAANWLKDRNGPSWLTPHPGELGRLFPDLVGETALNAASAAASRSGAAVVLKGARSVIASPDGRRWQIGKANAAVARAGLGDVLAGYVVGRGAMAMAALQGTAVGGDAQWLAVSALAHAQAGFAGGTPLNVANTLANGCALEQQRNPHTPGVGRNDLTRFPE